MAYVSMFLQDDELEPPAANGNSRYRPLFTNPVSI